jgi:hypothetical protein
LFILIGLASTGYFDRIMDIEYKDGSCLVVPALMNCSLRNLFLNFKNNKRRNYRVSEPLDDQKDMSLLFSIIGYYIVRCPRECDSHSCMHWRSYSSASWGHGPSLL